MGTLSNPRAPHRNRPSQNFTLAYTTSVHLALIGGGLANGLLALRLLERRGLSFELFETGASLGGNHTWSFHSSDVTRDQLGWLAPLVSHRWQGHEVAFHSYQRTLRGEYLSIRSF